MSQFSPLSETFAVAPSFSKADFAAAKAAGYAIVISNRFDGESPFQMSADAARAAAEAEGLVFVHIPVDGGRIADSDLDALDAAVAAHAGPVVAYCGSGKRSAALWALAQARAKSAAPDALIAAAGQAGHNLSGLHGMLTALYQA